MEEEWKADFTNLKRSESNHADQIRVVEDEAELEKFVLSYFADFTIETQRCESTSFSIPVSDAETR